MRRWGKQDCHWERSEVDGSGCSEADGGYVGKGSAVVGKGCYAVVVVVGRSSVVLVCPGWVGCGPRDQCGPIDVRIKSEG